MIEPPLTSASKCSLRCALRLVGFHCILLSQCLKAKSIGGGIHFARKESQKVGDYPRFGKRIPLSGVGRTVIYFSFASSTIPVKKKCCVL